MHGVEDMLVATHAEIVIGAPHRHSFILLCHVSAGEFLGETIDIIEIAVGFVLVLFVQLVLVKLFIIESRSVWGGRLWPTVGRGFLDKGLLRRWGRTLNAVSRRFNIRGMALSQYLLGHYEGRWCQHWPFSQLRYAISSQEET
jgi:hypothetical protein